MCHAHCVKAKCIVLMYSCLCQLHYSAKCIASSPLCNQCQVHCACVPLGQVHCVKITCVVAMCQCMCECIVVPSVLRQVYCAKSIVLSALCQVHCAKCIVPCAMCTALMHFQVHCAQVHCAKVPCAHVHVPVSGALCQVHCAKGHYAERHSAKCIVLRVPTAVLCQVHCASALCQVHCAKGHRAKRLVPSALRQLCCAECIVSRPLRANVPSIRSVLS